jgi:hypothetical protein
MNEKIQNVTGDFLHRRFSAFYQFLLADASIHIIDHPG